MTQEEKDSLINDLSVASNDTVVESQAYLEIFEEKFGDDWQEEIPSESKDSVQILTETLALEIKNRNISEAQIKGKIDSIKSQYKSNQELLALQAKSFESLATYTKLRDARLARNKMIHWTIGIIVVIILGVVFYKYVIKK